MRHNLAKEKLAIGEADQCGCPGYTRPPGRAARRMGFDAVFIDCEHGPAGWDEVENMVRAAELTTSRDRAACRRTTLRRSRGHSHRGAGGVQVPHINTRAEAEAAVRAAKFAPLGHRGYSGGRSAFGVAGNFHLSTPTPRRW